MGSVASLYLVLNLKFDIPELDLFTPDPADPNAPQPTTKSVKLLGAGRVGEDGLSFVVGSASPKGIASLADEELTREIPEPLGIRGVTLKDFGVGGRAYRDPGNGQKTRFDLDVHAKATFVNFHDLAVNAVLAFENTTLRLALLELTAERPVKLTELLHAIRADGPAWWREVTDQFEFGDCAMYYLRETTAGGPFQFPRSGTDFRIYQPGFRLQGKLRLFDAVDFIVAATVQRRSMRLSATAPDGFAIADFMTMGSTSIEIQTKPDLAVTLQASRLEVLGTPIANLAILTYVAKDKAFFGEIEVSLGELTLPTSGGRAAAVTLKIGVFRGKGTGFEIRKIGGLPGADLDLTQQFTDELNKNGGCQGIVKEWLKDLTKTTLKPSLDGSVIRSAERPDEMIVPLKLDYTLSAHDKIIASETIHFRAQFRVPASLRDLPAAIAASLLSGAGTIARDVLRSPATYKAIALEAMREAGATAIARFICRALFLLGDPEVEATRAAEMREVTKELAKEAKALTDQPIAAMAELAGQLLAVSLLEVPAIVTGLMALLKKIKDWLTGNSDDKTRAENEIRTRQRAVNATLEGVETELREMKRRISVQKLATSLEGDRVVVTATWAEGVQPSLERGTNLRCVLELMPGVPGSTQGDALLSVPDAWFPHKAALSSLPAGSEYRMNARARSVLKGVTFLDARSSKSLNDAIAALYKTDNDVAKSFARELEQRRDRYQSYDTDGIVTDWVPATSTEPQLMTVGSSRVGFNTRLAREV